MSGGGGGVGVGGGGGVAQAGRDILICAVEGRSPDPIPRLAPAHIFSNAYIVKPHFFSDQYCESHNADRKQNILCSFAPLPISHDMKICQLHIYADVVRV